MPDGSDSGLAGGQGVEHVFILAARGRPGGSATHPVKTGIYHNPMQPGRYRGIAAETGGATERRYHRILERVGRVFWIPERPDRYGR